MDNHRTVLGALFLALGVLGLIGMFVVFVVFSIGSVALGGAAANDAEVPAVLALLPAGIGLFVILMIAVSAVPSLIAGYGLLVRRSWARVWALVAGIVNLPSLPIGTAVGVYAIWFYLQDERPETKNHLSRHGVSGPA